VACGNFARFIDYTGRPNWFLPRAMIPAVAVLATGAEIVLSFSSSPASKRDSPLGPAEFFC
jgi:hypothetical protein